MRSVGRLGKDTAATGDWKVRMSGERVTGQELSRNSAEGGGGGRAGEGQRPAGSSRQVAGARGGRSVAQDSRSARPPETRRRAQKSSRRPGTRPGPSLTTCLLERVTGPRPPEPRAPPSSKTALPTRSRESREISRYRPTGISRACSGANMAAGGDNHYFGTLKVCFVLALGSHGQREGEASLPRPVRLP